MAYPHDERNALLTELRPHSSYVHCVPTLALRWLIPVVGVYRRLVTPRVRGVRRGRPLRLSPCVPCGLIEAFAPPYILLIVQIETVLDNNLTNFFVSEARELIPVSGAILAVSPIQQDRRDEATPLYTLSHILWNVYLSLSHTLLIGPMRLELENYFTATIMPWCFSALGNTFRTSSK